MKKLIIIFAFMLFALPAFSQTIEGGVAFDWISKTQMQRDKNISQIQNILFNEKTILKYPKKEFRNQYSQFLKDNDHIKNYQEVSQGKKEDDDRYYCAFYWKDTILVAYGIQYKKDMKHIFYYDALGSLRWIDSFSDNYPKFPYQSAQYNVNGKLVATYYFLSDYDQYVYGPNREFIGRWYKENLYNRKAKVTMTRSNY